MKKNIKLWIFLMLAVVVLVLLVLLVVMLGPKTKKTPQKADGENGVLYSDSFSSDSLSSDWIVGWDEAIAAPEISKNSMHLFGGSTNPCGAMLTYELPKKTDIYFTLDIKACGGNSCNPGVFFCIGEDYEQRYSLTFSEGMMLLSHNDEANIVEREVEGLKTGVACAVRISIDGLKLQVYLDGAETACLTFNGLGEYADFANARTFGVISHAQDIYFDNLVITNGTDFLPVTEIDIFVQDGKKKIEGHGNTLQMEAFVNPSNATDAALVWSVDNEAIADITQDGLLIAKGYGTVTVSARTRDGSNLNASSEIQLVYGEDDDKETILSTNRSSVLAKDCGAVFEGEEPDVYVLKNGRILVSGETKDGERPGKVVYSDDEGETWKQTFEGSIRSGRIFEADDKVYLMGEDSANKDLILYVSENEGESWSEKYVLDTRNWSSAPSEVIVQGKSLYLTMEVESASAVAAGYSGAAALSPILMKAEIGSDLTKAESWTFSSELAYTDIIKNGTAAAVDYVDVPNNYGDKSSTGWSCGNVFQIYDERLAWYDEDMKTFYIYLHGNEGTQGYASLLKVKEKDAKLTPSVVTAVTSNKTLLFVPMPGGNQKFNIVYDDKTELYWQVSNYQNDKNRLALYFSKNAYDWCFAGMAVKTEGRACDSPSMVIDGDDILIAAGQISLYRIEDFRSLVY